MHILVAEDQPLLQVLNRTLLTRWGFACDIVSDGIEAVEHAIRHPGRYDLGILDVEMPRMDGIEAVTAIRSAVGYFPILVLTSDESFRGRSLRAGADEFELKPCLPTKLFMRILELTVRMMVARTIDTKISLWQEKPVNPEQLKELRELDRKGLAILIVENGTQRFVVHKNIQNKMSHVLIGEGKELFEFIDRGENPAVCHLYKGNMQTNRLLLTPEEFQKRVEQEDRDIASYMHTADEAFNDNRE